MLSFIRHRKLLCQSFLQLLVILIWISANAQSKTDWKIPGTFAKTFIQTKNEEALFIVSGTDYQELYHVIQKLSPDVRILYNDEYSHSYLIKTTATVIRQKILLLKEVTYVDIRPEPHAETGIIGYNRSFHGINAVDYSIPGANGLNIVTGIKEQKMDANDIDLYKRVLPSSIASPNISNHATVISSIIGGAGNSFYDGRGIAWGCRFFPSSFDNLFPDDPSILTTNKITVQNHSYGTIIQQFYGAEAVSYDAQTWVLKNLIHVFSSGNRGSSFATEGKYANIPGYANLTGNFKMAKNVITVGAIDNKGNIAVESSAGPIYDGRLAPQLIALGPNGTSDAAAVVSGTIAVIQQVYADSSSQVLPSASLVKAVLYNNADDIYRKGIDFKTGYGLLNSFQSIKAIQRKEFEESFLSQGQQWTKQITVPASAAQLKVTLSWTDTTASLNNQKALINDLDLEVRDISTGTIYRPWVLSNTANADSLAKEPIRRRDSLNTAEQVSIDLPASGNYMLQVNGTSVLNSLLKFSVSWHIDTLNTFSFTSPQHTSDVNRDESPDLQIRWRTFVADTNTTGNLYISYDRGNNWELIKSNYKIYTDQYLWPVKDTQSTGVFKMETPFGNFLSKEFIIAPVTRLQVGFLCQDSFLLYWDKHRYASNYKLFALTDSPYLKHIATITDTSIVLNRNSYPSLIYAIEPVLSNGIPTARSRAIDITQQGVKCFYKTFYYNLQDQNLLELVVELSDPSRVDSIFFEQVTPSGQSLGDKGNAKVNAPNRIYTQLANNIPAGISYWRVRIKLKNGAILYTEIISVLTTGTRYIRFYPNPVRRGTPLNFVLQQGTGMDSRLQLYDISGRLLRSYSEMPNDINLDGIAAGILIYKLFNVDGRLLEVGKISVW